METFWWKIVGEKYLVEWEGTSWLGGDQTFNKADRGSNVCIYVGFASKILFNPKTGGDIFCKNNGDTNRQVNKCNLPLQNEH